MQDPTWVQLQKVATLCNNSRFILKDPNDDEKPAINLVSQGAWQPEPWLVSFHLLLPVTWVHVTCSCTIIRCLSFGRAKGGGRV